MARKVTIDRFSAWRWPTPSAKSVGREVLGAVHRALLAKLVENDVHGMDGFVEAVADDGSNPFLCDNAALEKLWAAKFRSKRDRSRTTPLQAGAQPGA